MDIDKFVLGGWGYLGRHEFEGSCGRCPQFSGVRRQGFLLRAVVSMGLRRLLRV